MALYTLTVPLDDSVVTADLAHDDAAWTEAVRFCGDMLRDVDGDLAGNMSWHMEVTEAQRLVATLRALAKRHAPPLEASSH